MIDTTMNNDEKSLNYIFGNYGNSLHYSTLKIVITSTFLKNYPFSLLNKCWIL